MSTTTYVFMQINIINTFWLQKRALSGAMLNKNTLFTLLLHEIRTFPSPK